MSRKLALAGLLVVTGAGLFAASAQAHTINPGKAQNYSLKLAFSVCKDDKTCYVVEVDPCKRVSDHKAVCKYVHYAGIDHIGPYDCEWVDGWKLTRSGAYRWDARLMEDTIVCYDDDGGHFRHPGDGAERRRDVEEQLAAEFRAAK